MKFTTKEYKITKTKSYIQTSNLFFFFNGINRNSNDWIIIEQKLKNINFEYYKIFNKTSKKTLENSIYKNVIPTINSITFLIKLRSNTKELSKQILLNNFEPLLFTLLAVKLNNKIYSTTQLKALPSLNYSENKLLLFQFSITNLKTFVKK
jgi:hypothetical protein